ncbi:hypothetical protein TSUD_251120 [Trifolium subterraneum]|uniref:Uncharacterized protein n=1 Tax=Trifolium subterraneum TaxID=3900 RepID=A0A2Z6MRM8_TRISU|nr:hypothetical protein TSUD_251120 [Trifolium subterraneum]
MNNLYDEQKLRDEVIYLHHLWHQGPPQQPNHIPRTLHNIPSSSSQSHYTPHFLPQLRRHPFPPSDTRSLPPVTSTAFKKRNKKKKKRERERTKPDPPRSLGPDWPCPKLPDSPKTGWGVPKPRSDSPPPSLQPQEKERLSVLQSQNKACKAFREFLIGSDEDSEVDDEEEEEDDDSDGRMEEFEEFFIGVFMKDNELRGYYQRCFESGEFFCLVCGAAEKKKAGKKYKDCFSLVQHSNLIVRTANKKAHRAFGQAVCKVLGWDIHRLPTIVITGEPLGRSMEINPAQSLGEPKESVAASASDDDNDDDDDDDGKDGSRKTEDIAVSLEHVEDPVEEYAKGADQSIGECSSKEGDIDANVVDIGLENEGGRFEMQGEIEDKVVSLAPDDEPVEQHERAVDQSISEVIVL